MTIREEMQRIAGDAKAAGRVLATLSSAVKDEMLGRMAAALEENIPSLLAANELNSAPELWTVVATEPRSVTPLDDSTELARFADIQPATGEQRYLRIRATYLP